MRKTVAALASGLLALGGAIAPSVAQAADPADVMITEYVEGSSYNKAIELYNPTTAPVDLGTYRINVFSNGKTTSAPLSLSGTTAPGATHVIVDPKASAALLAKGVATAGTWFNGDDALTLTKQGQVIDSVGRVGEQPAGGAWIANGISTKDRTLIKSGCTVDTTATDAFDPSADWTGRGRDDFADLGTFTGCTADQPAPATVAIGAVQGSGEASPMVGQTVTVNGVVTGDFHSSGFRGFFVQDGGDDDPATSDGIFVYDPAATTKVTVGASVRVTGRVSEYYNLTQITASTVDVVGKGALPAPAELKIPVTSPERFEGMRVRFADTLSILEYYNYGRYGSIVLGNERQYTPTAVVSPGQPAVELAKFNQMNRIVLDDGSSAQNPEFTRHPNGREFTSENYFRGGDHLSDVVGIWDYRNNEYKVQPTQGATYAAVNPRPAVPEVGGDVRVASFNVLNYFTTLRSHDRNARGADDAEEFARQQAKIVAALSEIDADVFGLMEIENNGTAVQNLVEALNKKVGADRYAAITTGKLGDDAITVAMIYKPATVTPAGAFAALDYADGKNRPTLAQTFTDKSTGKQLRVAVNHLKSKGSACPDPDVDAGDGQGNCNKTRLGAVEKMTKWLAATDVPTLVVGDMNSYDHEDPITAFAQAGYTDLEKKFGGEHAYSYVFDGMLGYLDYALANASLTGKVAGAASWHINADEANLFDYDMTFKSAAQDTLWQANPFRSSDHDPVIVGVDLADKPTPIPTPSPTVSPTPIPTPTSSPTVRPTPSPTATPQPPGKPPQTGK